MTTASELEQLQQEGLNDLKEQQQSAENAFHNLGTSVSMLMEKIPYPTAILMSQSMGTLTSTAEVQLGEINRIRLELEELNQSFELGLKTTEELASALGDELELWDSQIQQEIDQRRAIYNGALEDQLTNYYDSIVGFVNALNSAVDLTQKKRGRNYF